MVIIIRLLSNIAQPIQSHVLLPTSLLSTHVPVTSLLSLSFSRGHTHPTSHNDCQREDVQDGAAILRYNPTTISAPFVPQCIDFQPFSRSEAGPRSATCPIAVGLESDMQNKPKKKKSANTPVGTRYRAVKPSQASKHCLTKEPRIDGISAWSSDA